MTDDCLRVALKDGREIAVPIAWFDWLAHATAQERQDCVVAEGGAALWWESLEEGMSVPGLFGLPEDPPRPGRDRYEIRYRREGRKWIAEIPDFESSSPARSLAAAKREGRELLAILLKVEDLARAGIAITEVVESDQVVDTK